MIELSRRNFMGAAAMAAGMGAMGVGLGASQAFAGLDESGIDPRGAGLPWSGPGSHLGDWNGTPEAIKAVGGCTMPLEELNYRRKLYLDSMTEDYVCSDGTVIPVVFKKVTRLVGLYSYGLGNDESDMSYTFAYKDMSEEEAECFLDMPMGRHFTAYEFAAESGRDLEQCERVCESLASRAWLNVINNDRGTLYAQVSFVQGIYEYHDVDFARSMDNYFDFLLMSGDINHVAYDKSGAHFFGPAPVSRESVKDGAIYPYDDLRAIWATKNKFSLSPCSCRFLNSNLGKLELVNGDPNYGFGEYDLSEAYTEPCGHRYETCLSCGEEAQFWIDHGVGREISREEALAMIDRHVEDGFILQHILSKEAETICACHGDCCNEIASFKALHDEGILADSNTWQVNRHYKITADLDQCLKCGACADRCPMQCITMDGPDGTPQVGELCFACGQCTIVCPVSTRILEPLPEDSFPPLPQDIFDMNNMLCARRFEAGLIW